ncbi:MAG: FkbM family methyltransferase [Candidatus Shapirobacteria bacterium]|nr:FkbM family methyltransferase [Candidatus Shapirobacteria bacterium]
MKKYFELLKSYNPAILARAGLKEIHRKLWREIVRGSYAQNYEDLLINKLIKKTKGIYLEIGGYHPTRLSNTYYFYKKGWRGTVVEPNPEIKVLFNKIRPEDKFINAGISDKNSEMDYYQFLIPAINTFSKVEAEKNIKRGHKLSKVTKTRLIKVELIVNENIDLLSLDTEGFDEKILNSWPWEKVKPTVICVETNVEELLKKQGYLVAVKTKANLIFLLKN